MGPSAVCMRGVCGAMWAHGAMETECRRRPRPAPDINPLLPQLTIFPPSSLHFVPHPPCSNPVQMTRVPLRTWTESGPCCPAC